MGHKQPRIRQPRHVPVNVNLRQVRSFIKIAELGSFTRAAVELNLSQPSLTVQIRELESNLRVRLLERSTRSVQLTTTGKELLPVFTHMVDELDSVVADAHERAAQRRGLVRIGCLLSFASTSLPLIVARFQSAYPGVQFVMKDIVGTYIQEMVKSGAVDFAITADGVNNADLEIVQELFKERIHAIYPKDHPLSMDATIQVAKLFEYPLIVTDEVSSVRQVVNEMFANARLVLTPAYQVTHNSTAIGLVRAGLGVALLPAGALELHSVDAFESRPIDSEDAYRSISVVRKRGHELSGVAQIFLDSLLSDCAPQDMRNRPTIEDISPGVGRQTRCNTEAAPEIDR